MHIATSFTILAHTTVTSTTCALTDESPPRTPAHHTHAHHTHAHTHTHTHTRKHTTHTHTPCITRHTYTRAEESTSTVRNVRQRDATVERSVANIDEAVGQRHVRQLGAIFAHTHAHTACLRSRRRHRSPPRPRAHRAPAAPAAAVCAHAAV
jgi:hypothetical protein